jgi:metal-responsive CopG/Arc/MetJ family transcriptional regulator
MVDHSRAQRLQIMLDEDELKAIDDWRFVRRMPSRASAIRELLRRGLAAEGADVAHSTDKSKDYGVITSPPKVVRQA